MITKRSKVRAINNQVTCNLSEETMIFSLGTGMCYSLNPIGSRIWSLIKNPLEVERICTYILQEFDIDAYQCENEILALLSDLEKEGLIVIENPEKP